MNTMFDLQQYALQELKDTYTEHEIKVLCSLAFCKLLHCTNIEIHLNKHEFLAKSFIDKFILVVEELKADKPIQYILGETEFSGIDFQLNSETLIPRPETAELVDWVARENTGACHLLDIGTGSGCIAISLDKKLPDAEVEAWDISEEVLAIAQENNKALEAGVTFLKRNVLADDWDKTPSFDVIVSNPPYVTETEKAGMDANVLDWEPGLALFVPDDDPLRFYRRIAEVGRELLLPGGRLYFEINQAYGRETAHMLEMNQYHDVRVIKDIFGKDRIVTANQ